MNSAIASTISADVRPARFEFVYLHTILAPSTMVTVATSDIDRIVICVAQQMGKATLSSSTFLSINFCVSLSHVQH